uniref:GDSL esterase/lipase n=1 Tax=Oryza punctata TaxID=4537 RepID=A0A0E0L7A8_ORYPU
MAVSLTSSPPWRFPSGSRSEVQRVQENESIWRSKHTLLPSSAYCSIAAAACSSASPASISRCWAAAATILIKRQYKAMFSLGDSLTDTGNICVNMSAVNPTELTMAQPPYGITYFGHPNLPLLRRPPRRRLPRGSGHRDILCPAPCPGDLGQNGWDNTAGASSRLGDKDLAATARSTRLSYTRAVAREVGSAANGLGAGFSQQEAKIKMQHLRMLGFHDTKV